MKRPTVAGFRVLACGLAMWSLTVPGTVRADPLHIDFDLKVDPPHAVGDQFHLTLAATARGSSANGAIVKTKYMVTLTQPDGVEHAILGTPADPASEGANSEASSETDLSFVPGENGPWVFSVWRLDGGARALAVQRQVQIDKAQPGVMSPGVSTAPASHQIASITIDPSPAATGQPVKIAVQLRAGSGAGVPTEMRASLVGDDGFVQPIGAVQLTNGSGTLVWVPQQTVNNGRLVVGDADGLFSIAVGASSATPVATTGPTADQSASPVPSDADAAPPTTGDDGGPVPDAPQPDNGSESPP
jgi:hypothetical protein